MDESDPASTLILATRGDAAGVYSSKAAAYTAAATLLRSDMEAIEKASAASDYARRLLTKVGDDDELLVESYNQFAGKAKKFLLSEKSVDKPLSV